MNKPLRILLVEDNPADARLIQILLAERPENPCEVVHADSLESALAALRCGLFDAILLDPGLPDSDSAETLPRIRPDAGAIPIVMLSGHADDEVAVNAVRHGAQDYLVKGRIDAELLSRALRYAIERARSERALRDSESRFRAVVESNLDALFILKPVLGPEGAVVDFAFEYANPRAEELLGAPSSRIVGARAGDFLPNTVRRYNCIERFREVSRSGTPEEIELEIDEPPFPRMTLQEQVVPFGDGVLVLVHDITARRKAEADLRAREEELRHMQKIEAVGLLASGVAHDFNNLLTAIRGYASLARATLAESHPAVESLEQVEEASRQAAGVASALLTFARKTRPEKAPVQLASAVEAATRLFRRTLRAGIKLVVDTSRANALWVHADSTQLQQVVMNLGLNARDAITDEGTITITVEPARSGARLIVRDTGTGMTPDVAARIFEPFFTTKPRGQGTGLGLSVIHGIVQEHNGTIELATAPGQGSTFTVTLPTVAAPHTGAQRLPHQDDVAARAPHALLIEDNPLVRGLLTSMLDTLGYEVVASSTPDEALSLAATAVHPFELAVIETTLPGAGIATLLQQLRERSHARHAIFVGSTNLPNPPPAGTATLKKPFQVADLSRAIASLADTSAPEVRR